MGEEAEQKEPKKEAVMQCVKIFGAHLLIAVLFYVLPVLVFGAEAQLGPEASPLPLWAQSVNKFINAFAQRIFDLAVVLTSVGVASMALIETTKNLFPSIHRRFHRRRVKNYLMRQTDLATRRNHTVSFEKAWDKMILLAAAGNERALFNLPAEQMVAQIGAAARVVLDFPREEQCRDLFCSLTAQAEHGDLDLVMMGKEQIPEPTKSRYVDARNRVFPVVQRSLDALLISMKDDWTWWNRAGAVALSVVLILSALAVSGNLKDDARLGFYLIAAILGGFVAPVAKDLVASLERFRKK